MSIPVSIRTRSGERVMRRRRQRDPDRRAVSIRTRSGERVMPEVQCALQERVKVSIRTRSGERVMRLSDDGKTTLQEFQSAPALVSG